MRVEAKAALLKKSANKSVIFFISSPIGEAYSAAEALQALFEKTVR